MSRGGWFETTAEAQRRARRSLPRPVYSALLAGSEAGRTRDDNVAAFAELGFAPHVADLPGRRDLSTVVLGQRLSMPVLLSPTGVQAMHPDGEVPVARAAASRGVPMGLSCFAAQPIETVVAANPVTLSQVHWAGDRSTMLGWIERARRAGAVGLIATMDWSFATGRDWGSPYLPERIDLRSAARYAPAVLARPGWLLRYLRAGRLPELTVPNMARDGEPAPGFFAAYRRWQDTAPPSWADIAWLSREWGGPFMVKGITRVDDAKAAVDAGVSAISVSNHGGNNLDGTPGTIRCLPAIVDAVGDQVEVLLDGGVRRGGDVVKALALGAKAVMIGRAYLWGLAANGQAGVENVLDIMRGGIDSTLLALGREGVGELRRDDVVVPPDFGRTLGARRTRSGGDNAGHHCGLSRSQEQQREAQPRRARSG